MIENEKNDVNKLEDEALESVSGGMIIPGTDLDSPVVVPSTVIDDRTLEVLGQTDSTEAAVKLAQSLGVSTERITSLEYENLKEKMGTTIG